jgi:hypothetical protein
MGAIFRQSRWRNFLRDQAMAPHDAILAGLQKYSSCVGDVAGGFRMLRNSWSGFDTMPSQPTRAR